MSKRKIFLGLTDVASFIDDWRAGFEANGYEVLAGSSALQNPMDNSKLDFVIDKTKNKVKAFSPKPIGVRVKSFWDRKVSSYYFNKAINECDTFVFFWNSFSMDASDFKLLKEKEKKIITVFCGDDCRWHPARDQEYDMLGIFHTPAPGYDYSVASLEKRLRYLRNAEKYSNITLNQPNQAQIALRPYHNLTIPIIAKSYKHKPQQNEIPTIVHAPTSISKGSQFIAPIIERLKNEGYKFNYTIIQNTPREKALEIYSNGDIILDQIINSPGGGKFALEGLAMGKIVLCIMAYDVYDQKKPHDCPIIDVNKDTLYDKLKELITNKELRTELATKGRSFVEKYHDPKKIASEVLEQLNSPEKNNPEFVPNFFRDKFIPESNDAIAMYNKWNRVVENEPWYKQSVKRGERSGLVF